MKQYFSVFLLVLTQLTLYAQETKITIETGRKTDEKIVFFTYYEPFYQLQDTLFVVPAGVNEDAFYLNLEKTTCLYAEYGPYECYFFAEPGREYRVKLPDISGIKKGYGNNPLYNKAGYHLELKYSDTVVKEDLNEAIRTFNKLYEPFYDRQMLRFFNSEKAMAKLDSFKLALPEYDSLSDPEYYETYVVLKLAELAFTAKRYTTAEMIDRFFMNRPVAFNNPPYRKLFKLLFADYFDYLRRVNDFEKIYTGFTRISFQYMREYLKKDKLLQNDTLMETILLHEIYNAYYSGDYEKRRMVAFADSVFQATAIPEIKSTAAYLLNVFTWLQPGYEAPGFELVRGKDTLNPENLRGIHVLIGFLQPGQMSSLQEFEILKYFNSRHSEYLKILAIVPGDSAAVCRFFPQVKGMENIIIPVDPDSRVLKDYRVKMYPTFYLIDNEGTMRLSPCPLPSEGLEQKLFYILRQAGVV